MCICATVCVCSLCILSICESVLFVPCSELGPPLTTGPPSASLLRDWLDVRQLDPDNMDALQRELETGNPDMFLQGFSEL